MLMEDGAELVEAAVESLRGQKEALNLPDFTIVSMPRFREVARAAKLTRADKEVICEQAILVVDQFYAHLPFKRARYAFDPVQRLRLLHAQIPRGDDDLRFHSALLRVFADMRDAHTFYGLPAPYGGATAFLPFFMKCYEEEGRRRFVVTNVLTGLAHPAFKPGVEVTGWNGMAVSSAVERLAESVAAGNRASRFLRGLMQMTIRPLSYTLPPDEEAVFVQYTPDDGAGDRVLALPWNVATGMTGGLLQARASGICEPVAGHNAARHVLWGQREWEEQAELQIAEAEAAATRLRVRVYSCPQAVPRRLREDGRLFSKVPAIFDFQHPSGVFLQGSIAPNELCGVFEGAAKRFGYVRIKSFAPPPDTIFTEFRRILDVMNECAPDGLIVDVRGNPGGSIKGAERLLQLLTPKTITPAAFHFANTPTIQEILDRLAADNLDDMMLKAEFDEWIGDGFEALASGKPVTDGHPLTSHRSANDTGQVYQSPVALLIDAASYSATDIFAAGFQDHGIGLIIGVDDNTGGGGGSRWLHHDDLLEKLRGIPDLPLKKLPAGAVLGFAHLRASRAGNRAGDSLEDVGVTCNKRWSLTKKDLMDFGSDLVGFACAQLAALPVRRLEILSAGIEPDGLRVTVRATNLDRLVCYLDEQLRFVVNANVSSFTIPLDDAERGSKALSIRGMARKDGKLEAAAACRRPLTGGAMRASPEHERPE